MKKLILSAAALLFTVGVFAQAPLGYGIKAGVNLPTYKITGANNNELDIKSTTNFHITGYLDAALSPNFSIQPGISLQGKGAKSNLDPAGSVSQNTMWLEIPVNAVAKFPTSDAGNFFIGAGPYGAYGISGKEKYSGLNVDVEDDGFKFGKDESQKRFDAGVNFLAGYQLSSGLTIGAGYGLGLMNIAPGDSGDGFKNNNRVLSFSVGFAL